MGFSFCSETAKALRMAPQPPVKGFPDCQIAMIAFCFVFCWFLLVLQPYLSPAAALRSSALRQLYFNSNSALLKPYFSLTSALLRRCFRRTSALLQAYFSPTSALLQLYFSTTFPQCSPPCPPPRLPPCSSPCPPVFPPQFPALLQPYFSSTSALLQPYVSPTSALLRPYFSSTSALLQLYAPSMLLPVFSREITTRESRFSEKRCPKKTPALSHKCSKV